MADLPSAQPNWDEIADGFALWEEHKPQTREDWLRMAQRWHVVNDEPPDNPAPMFGALYDAAGEIARLRAGIQWARGMCSDGEPLEAIDAKLGEILNG